MSLIALVGTFFRDRRAAAAVEFALIALPFLLLLIGSIEVSRFVWTRHAVEEATSSGARCLGLRRPPCFAEGSPSRSGTAAFVRDRAAGWMIMVPESAVTIEENVECSGVPGFLRVAVQVEFFSVLSTLTGSTIEADACFPMMTAG